MRLRLIILLMLVAAAFALPICAYYIPTGGYKDSDVGLSPLQIDKLRGEAEMWSDFPAVVMQVTEGDPEGAEDYDFPDGVVIWRTIFGIEYGRTETRHGQSYSHFEDDEFNRAWLMLIVPELAMTGLGSLLLLSMWWQRRRVSRRANERAQV